MKRMVTTLCIYDDRNLYEIIHGKENKYGDPLSILLDIREPLLKLAYLLIREGYLDGNDK